MDHLVGIQKWITSVPWFVLTPVLWVVCVGVLWPMRKVFEGMAYNVSRSSQWGDVFLIGVAGAGPWVLSRVNEPLSPVVGSLASQIVLLAFCFAATATHMVAMPLHQGKGTIFRQEWAEIYHGLVIVPLLGYLVLTALFVTGYQREWFVLGIEVLFLVGWMWLVFHDAITGKLDQQQYIKDHPPGSSSATYFWW